MRTVTRKVGELTPVTSGVTLMVAIPRSPRPPDRGRRVCILSDVSRAKSLIIAHGCWRLNLRRTPPAGGAPGGVRALSGAVWLRGLSPDSRSARLHTALYIMERAVGYRMVGLYGGQTARGGGGEAFPLCWSPLKLCKENILIVYEQSQCTCTKSHLSIAAPRTYRINVSNSFGQDWQDCSLYTLKNVHVQVQISEISMFKK